MLFGHDPFELLLWYVAFLLSTTLHEAAHAWAAMKGGDMTAYMVGQVSLDPSPHIRREPFGMVVLPLISLLLNGWPFGFASAPYDPCWAERHPRRASLMALAGPSANLLLVLFSAFAIWIGIFLLEVFAPPDRIMAYEYSRIVVATGNGFWEAAAMLLSIMFVLNLILFVLNLIPFPPLDGSSVLGLFLSERRAQRWRDLTRQPGVSVMGLLIAYYLFAPVFTVVYRLALLALYTVSGLHVVMTSL